MKPNVADIFPEVLIKRILEIEDQIFYAGFFKTMDSEDKKKLLDERTDLMKQLKK